MYLLYKSSICLYACVRACVRVCLCAIQIHSSRPISTKLGTKHFGGQGQSKVRLLMHLVEPRSTKEPAKTGSAYIPATAGPILTKVGVWMHNNYTMCKYHF